MPPTKSNKKVKMRTVTGKVKLDQDVTVQVPALNVNKKAILAPHSPNLAALGRMIIQEGYSLEWTKEGGLTLRDPRGGLIPTHVDNYVAMLGEAPKYALGGSRGKIEFDEDFVKALDQVIGEALHELTDGALFCHARL